MDTVTTTARPLACETNDCATPGSTRREFLQSAGCFGMAVALLGLSAAQAAALPVYLTEGGQAGGGTRDPIPPAHSVNVDPAAQLIVTRFEGYVYVLSLSWPHQ